MPFIATNPLSQRVAVLERLWQEFRRLPNARLCRWLFAPDEDWLLPVFLDEQAGPDAISNDIFVTLHAPVSHWQAYFEQALTELSALIGHDLALLTERRLVVHWTVEPKKGEVDPLARFVGYLNRFVNGLRDHTDGVLVLCLLPQTFASDTVLDQMLTALVQSGLSPDIRLLVADTTGAERLTNLASRFRTAVYSHPVDLQLQKMTRQLAAMGSPVAPDVKFRQWHAELATAITQRNLRDVDYFANNCLLICQQENWPILAGSVHLSVAYAYADHRRYEEALARYNGVIDQMEALFGQGDEAAGRISLTAWLGAGGVYESLRQRPRAIDCYERAGERAELLGEWLLGIESHRRLGLLHAQDSRMRLSETHYGHLFRLAEYLPPDQHRPARLAAIGQTYWQQQKTPDQRRQADERLTGLLGAGWRS